MGEAGVAGVARDPRGLWLCYQRSERVGGSQECPAMPRGPPERASLSLAQSRPGPLVQHVVLEKSPARAVVGRL